MNEGHPSDGRDEITGERIVRIRRSDASNAFLGSLGAAGLVGLASLLWTIVNSITANYTNAIKDAEGRVTNEVIRLENRVNQRFDRCCRGR